MRDRRVRRQSPPIIRHYAGFYTDPTPLLARLQPKLSTRSSDAAVAYAAHVGLTRFSIDGAQAGQYRIDRSTGQPNVQSTGRAVTSLVRSNNRPRINLPVQLGGHFVCTNPENVAGIFWCLDLLKAATYSFTSQRHLVPKGLAGRAIGEELAVPDGGVAENRRKGQNGNVIDAFGIPADGVTHTPGYRSQSRRVLMIISTYALGGAERQMLIAAFGLLQRGYDMRNMDFPPCSPRQPNIEDEVKELRHDAPCLFRFPAYASGRILGPRSPAGAKIPGLPPWFTNKVSPVDAAIRKYRPSVVHALMDIPIAVSAFAACRLGTPRVVLNQCSMQWCMRRYGAQVVDFLWEGYRSAVNNPTVKVLNNSAAGASDYERWLHLRPGTIEVIRNALPRGPSVKLCF